MLPSTQAIRLLSLLQSNSFDPWFALFDPHRGVVEDPEGTMQYKGRDKLSLYFREKHKQFRSFAYQCPEDRIAANGPGCVILQCQFVGIAFNDREVEAPVTVRIECGEDGLVKSARFQVDF